MLATMRRGCSRTRSSSCSAGGTESACSSCLSSGCVCSLVSTGISSESAINSRLRSISRPMMYSSLRSTTAAASLRLLFLQLPLPVEHACLGALRLGLGHHAGGLVEARQAGVREDVVGRELAELLPRLDRLRVPPELVERHGEPVPGVDVAGVEGERFPVLGDRFVELAVAEEIDRLVVEVLLAGHCGSVAHSRAPGQARKRGGRAPPSVVWDVPMPLEAELATALEAAGRGTPPPDFAAWALRLFAHQFERNAPYRAFCERRGVTPATVARWEDVPAVPSAAFRRVDLACGLPDAARLPCLCLAPPPALRPESSLVQMCVWVGEGLASGIEWMIGERGLETERLLARLAAAEASGEALLLLGVTAAFAQLFDACRARGRAFRLGPASRVVDTGGQKGMTRPLSRPGFLRECWTLLGIPGYYCINEYGMTELCSQRYDSALDDRFHGRSLAPRRLTGPAWLRTRVLDPDTLAAVAPGATGLLCHHDLANAGSVSVVLSEDLGRAVGDDGIEVLGRVAGAAPRGCGLLLADLEAP